MTNTLLNAAFPGIFPGALTTGYLTMGGAQPQGMHLVFNSAMFSRLTAITQYLGKSWNFDLKVRLMGRWL